MPYLNRPIPNPEPIDCKILTAALSLFVEHGYHSVSIHEIQKISNVSIGSIYKYFNGKEGIASSLYKHILSEIEELVDTVIRQQLRPRDQCEALISALFEHTETHPDIIAFAFHTKHSEFLSGLPLVCNTTPFRKMREIVQRGMDQGDFSDTDIWVASATLFGSVSKLIQLRLDGMLEKPLPEYTQQVFAIIWQGLSARIEATAEQNTLNRRPPALKTATGK